jgi:hypothetical protein
MSTVKQMHIMRIKEEEARRLSKKKKPYSTPLAKEIELRREAFIRGVLEQTTGIINQQLAVASLPVSPDGPDNDTVMKATNSLLDRVFGKPKETVHFTVNVQFSLKALAQERLKVSNKDVTPLEDMI